MAAYGSKKGRQALAESILQGFGGDSIQDQIDAELGTAKSATTGTGATMAEDMLGDTESTISDMKQRSLGARMKEKKEVAEVKKDKGASFARDWMALLMGHEEKFKEENATYLSDKIAAESSAPLSEVDADEVFLRTGRLPEDEAEAEVVLASSEYQSTIPMEDRIFAPEEEGVSTGNGLMSPDQRAIEQAVEEAMSQGEPTERLDSKGLTPVTTTSHAQQRLSDLGYIEVGDADGVAGANTRTAVRRYQQQNGLTTTGRLDPPTLESLTGAEADLDTVIQRQIAHHEGQKNYPYKDSKGLWTIGIGHLIGNGSDEALAASDYSEYSESNPMPDSEVTELFEEDLEDHKAIAESYDFYEGMSKKGKRAILDLTFNMGDFYNKKKPNGDYEWANLRTQLDAGNWDEAADNLASSAYARQVGQRATTVTDLLRQAGD